MPVVALRSVGRAFKVGAEHLHVVRDVSIDVEEGEFVAIVGPSGSGKSTLMNLMGLLDRPTSGKVILDGIDVASLNDDELAALRGRSIGFVFQSYNLLPRATACENVQLPLTYLGVQSGERGRRATEMLSRLGMLPRAHHYPRQLSGGEQQRVAIARAVVTSPSLILADEPTGALDSRTGDEILTLFRGLHRAGATIVIITHDLGVAARCDRMIRVVDGRICCDANGVEQTNHALKVVA